MPSGNASFAPRFDVVIRPPAHLSAIFAHLKSAARGKNFFPNRAILEEEIIKADVGYDGEAATRLANWLVNVNIILHDGSRCFYDDDRARLVGEFIKKNKSISISAPDRLERIKQLKRRPLVSQPFMQALHGMSIAPAVPSSPEVPSLEERVRMREEANAAALTRTAEPIRRTSVSGIVVARGYTVVPSAEEIRVLALSADALSALPPHELDEHIRQLDWAFGKIRTALDNALDIADQAASRRRALEEQVGMLQNLAQKLKGKLDEVHDLIAAKNEQIDRTLS